MKGGPSEVVLVGLLFCSRSPGLRIPPALRAARPGRVGHPKGALGP